MLLDFGGGHAATGHVQHGFETDVIQHGIGDGDARSGFLRTGIACRMPSDVAKQGSTSTHVLKPACEVENGLSRLGMRISVVEKVCL